MGFFSIDGKFFRALTKAGDFFILAALGLVFSLPVVTIGPTLTAVNYVALKLVRDEEGYVWRGFWKAWKSNFKQAFIIQLILMAIAAVFAIDIKICYTWLYTDGSNVARIILFAVLGLSLVLVAVTIYVFPVLSKFDNTVIATLKNSLVLCMHHLPQTIVMLIITCALTYFSLEYFTAFIITIPLIYYINAFVLSRIFQQYVKQAEEDEAVDKAEKSEITEEMNSEYAESNSSDEDNM